jgi:hypothetical protein
MRWFPRGISFNCALLELTPCGDLRFGANNRHSIPYHKSGRLECRFAGEGWSKVLVLDDPSRISTLGSEPLMGV